MSKIIGYEIGDFEDGRFVGFADCTPCAQPREVIEQQVAEWNANPLNHPSTEYRVIEIRDAS